MKTVKITAILTLIAILSASLISCVNVTKYGFERAESFSIGGFEISAENIEFDKLEINWVSGSVKLTPNNKNVISVTETEQTSEDNKLRYELAGHVRILLVVFLFESAALRQNSQRFVSPLSSLS